MQWKCRKSFRPSLSLLGYVPLETHTVQRLRCQEVPQAALDQALIAAAKISLEVPIPLALLMRRVSKPAVPVAHSVHTHRGTPGRSSLKGNFAAGGD